MPSVSDFHLVELDHEGRKPTMLCGYVGDLQIVVHTAEAPRPKEWTTYLRSLPDEGTRIKVGIVRTLGGGPDAAQRRETAESNVLSPAVLRFAVLSDVPWHGPMIAALNLFQRVPIKVFPGYAVDGAVEYLRTEVSAAEVRLHMDNMAARLGIQGLSVAPPVARRWFQRGA